MTSYLETNQIESEGWSQIRAMDFASTLWSYCSYQFFLLLSFLQFIYYFAICV